VQWPAIANQPYIGFTSVKGPVDLNQVAQLTQLSLSDVKTLNPGFRRSYTAHGEHSLVLPLSKMALFAKNRPQLRAVRLTETRQYRVKSGDSLGLIASKNGTTVADQLKVGQQLFLSVASTAGTNGREPSASRQSGSYQVKSGDNLWLIAKQFKVDGAALAKFNKLSANSRLKPGQTLKIPASRNKATVGTTDKNRVYLVKSGDSLDKIAKKQKVKLADLLRWNALTTESLLQPGQKLQLK
jgi:membrane-bound lytic murein transglycosylase D